MLKLTSRALTTAILGTAVAGTSASAQDITIGWTAWSDAEFVTKLAEQILENRADYDVELTQTDIAPQYQGIAQGDIDMMLMSWQPGTHGDYLDGIAGEYTDLGPIYTHARLGWVVPDYIPEEDISSIADLKSNAVRERLDGEIVGIDPGAGLSQLSEDALEDYGLDGYNIQFSSGAGMTAALDRAINREEWIVVTGWSPHWKFGAYDLRYLEDPEGSLGGAERIHALTRTGFHQDHPEATDIITRMFIPISMLENYMAFAQENSYEEAVDKFIEEQSDRVDYWVNGEF
ncbi:glycine betaine ABC transporter substrate-binding protein [Aquisalimonas lutea]|uniref:glycine betaine ABC transporter substrate-binding protein n=1 Tax=Aquisalimonas lutea TaxID=1327750 RepID=UPI0025B5B656|nr:glycine betaine ABC transporter substrate-binding protein [Aquisalimonas lutea]MDN3518630.1 glycine betaine ABC transporter substrate-binding protein [Aquisalimonas lutea]